MVQTRIKNVITIDYVRQLLAEGRTKEALTLIKQHGDLSEVRQHARGVCLLRLGSYERALEVLRRTVFPGGSICVPTVYHANFATAMLLTRQMDGAPAKMDHLNGDNHAYLRQLMGAVEKWRKSLNPAGRVKLVIGKFRKRPVRLDFPLGGI